MPSSYYVGLIALLQSSETLDKKNDFADDIETRNRIGNRKEKSRFDAGE